MQPDPIAKPWHIEKDRTGFDLGTNLWTAIVLFVFMVLQQIYLPIGWEFDMNSPDFNPLIFLPLLLIGTTLWNLGKGLLLWRRLRRFGTATMELHGPAAPAPGRVCRGLVRTARPLAATGDFQFTLRCVEGYRFRRPGEIRSTHDRYEHVTAWEETQTVPAAEADPRTGLAFEFQLPEVGPLAQFIEPAASSDKPYFRMKASINIPGFKKRVITHNQKPDLRAWWLEVTAPTPEGTFRAQFQVPVQEAVA